MSLRTRLFHLWFLISRPMTLGVRIVVTNREGHVLLVRHTYIDGWHLPGGGVDPGENCETAIMRELREETGVVAPGEPILFGLYFNNSVSNRDHVALYSLGPVDGGPEGFSSAEIAEVMFFPPDALPENINEATARRLDEISGEVEISPYW